MERAIRPWVTTFGVKISTQLFSRFSMGAKTAHNFRKYCSSNFFSVNSMHKHFQKFGWENKFILTKKNRPAASIPCHQVTSIVQNHEYPLFSSPKTKGERRTQSCCAVLQIAGWRDENCIMSWIRRHHFPLLQRVIGRKGSRNLLDRIHYSSL